MKTFSIIIPSYNSKNFIKNTLLSIINSDYDKTKIEVIVVDDCSTDDTYQYVNEFIKPYFYIKQIKNTKNTNWGGILNFVRKNRLAKNEIISVLDADDQYMPDTFKIINERIKKHDIFIGSFKKFNGKKTGIIIPPYFFLFKRVVTNYIQKNTPICLPLIFFMKSYVFYQCNDLTENCAYQDPDFVSQIMKNSNSIYFTWKTTGLYYFNRPNNSQSIDFNDVKRYQPSIDVLYKVLKNGYPDIISYRLCEKPLYNIIKDKGMKFNIEKNITFKWLPWYLRWAYFLFIYLIKQKNFFIKDRNE